MRSAARPTSYVFLCIVPIAAILVAAPRQLRVAEVYQGIGAALFAAIVWAAWGLGARAIASGAVEAQLFAFSGTLLITPFTLISLLWVGLGPPWVATPDENVMRYIVLLVSSIAVTAGLLALGVALSEAGERAYSTLGFAIALLGGCAYLIWMVFALGISIEKVRDGQVSATISSLNGVLDLLLLVAGMLTYLATAAYAAAMGRAGWLGRASTRTYIAVNLIAMLLLAARGVAFPNPANLATPWYANPGFIVGIPAIPFIIPHLFGAVLLRRAFDRLA